jgi:enolase-phosphatase E1
MTTRAGRPADPSAPVDLRAKVVVLDIEGTTSPAGFVVDTLYPYSRARFASWIEAHRDDGELRRALADVERLAGVPAGDVTAVVRALDRWLDADEKVTPLKTVQGQIWDAGFAAGELTAPFFPDVAPALRAWAASGARLLVYSSGSVAAQRAYVTHSGEGDLSVLVSGFFDTRTAGPKREADSYRTIARTAGADGADLAFLSDRREELDAARAAGWATVGVCRPGEPYAAAGVGDHPRVASFAQIRFTPEPASRHPGPPARSRPPR